MSEHAPISVYDAAKLDRFFATTIERSLTGAILERGAAFGIAALEDKAGKSAHNATLRRQAVSQGLSLAALPWDLDPVTAQPINETHSYDPKKIPVMQDFGRSADHAFVSRRLERMAQRGAGESVLVLQVYFGAIGAHYATGQLNPETKRAGHPLPRVFSLMHVVPAGVALLDKAQDLLGGEIRSASSYVRMRQHCTTRGSRAYKARREIGDLFARAELQAVELYAAAGAAWNAATGGGF